MRKIKTVSDIEIGDRLRVTFTGIAKSKHASIPDSHGFTVQRDNCKTETYITDRELAGNIIVEAEEPPFDPKPGEVYLVQLNNGSRSPSPWIVSEKGTLISKSSTATVDSFKRAYIGDTGFSVTKAKF